MHVLQYVEPLDDVLLDLSHWTSLGTWFVCGAVWRSIDRSFGGGEKKRKAGILRVSTYSTCADNRRARDGGMGDGRGVVWKNEGKKDPPFWDLIWGGYPGKVPFSFASPSRTSFSSVFSVALLLFPLPPALPRQARGAPEDCAPPPRPSLCPPDCLCLSSLCARPSGWGCSSIWSPPHHFSRHDSRLPPPLPPTPHPPTHPPQARRSPHYGASGPGHALVGPRVSCADVAAAHPQLSAVQVLLQPSLPLVASLGQCPPTPHTSLTPMPDRSCAWIR